MTVAYQTLRAFGTRLVITRSPGLEIRAWFSEDRRRRWLLSAWWGPGPRLPWVMLNPSLAGSMVHGDNLDPTLRRVRGFTKADPRPWGGFEVANLYDLVDPDPKGLALEDPAELGPNRGWLTEIAHAGLPVVVGWGAHRKAQARSREVYRQILEPAGTELLALTTTSGGHPGHPLYLPGRLELEAWRPPWPG